MSESKIFDIETPDTKTVIINVNFNPSIDADLVILSQVSQVKDLIHNSRPSGVIFDFSQSNYFGSSMLEAVLEIWNLIKESEGKMVICELSDIGKEILELSKLDTLWTIKPTRSEALEEVKA